VPERRAVARRRDRVRSLATEPRFTGKEGAADAAGTGGLPWPDEGGVPAASASTVALPYRRRGGPGASP
jgi:hypothetical protein